MCAYDDMRWKEIVPNGFICNYYIFAESVSSVKTKCIQVDFVGGLEIYDIISANLSGLEIGVLGSVTLLFSTYMYKLTLNNLAFNRSL